MLVSSESISSYSSAQSSPEALIPTASGCTSNGVEYRSSECYLKNGGLCGFAGSTRMSDILCGAAEKFVVVRLRVISVGFLVLGPPIYGGVVLDMRSRSSLRAGIPLLA
jgi:hypothetical protein